MAFIFAKLLANERISSKPISVRQLQRSTVLQSIWEDIEWLTGQAHKKRPTRSDMRVRLIRAKFYGCQVLLSGLKDLELDKIMEELEAVKKYVGMGSNVAITSTSRSKIH